jgi:hypothetical protein
MRELVLASDGRRSRENTRLARHLVPQCGPHIKVSGFGRARIAPRALNFSKTATPGPCYRSEDGSPEEERCPRDCPCSTCRVGPNEYGPKNQNTKIAWIAKPTVVKRLEEPFPRLRQNRASF